MQGRLSSWLVKHGLIHRSLGFDYLGIETLQIKPEDWHSIAVILYVYGYNYLLCVSQPKLFLLLSLFIFIYYCYYNC